MSSGTNPQPRGAGEDCGSKTSVEPRGVPVVWWPIMVVVAPFAALLSWAEFKVNGRRL